MNKILLIGNSGTKKHGNDGQTIKVRLYLKKIRDEGFDVEFVDLESFLRRPILTLKRIKIGIRSCDRIVLISAHRGCKFLIPFINKINRKYKKPFVLPLIGISVLHCSVDNLSDEEKSIFFSKKNYSLTKKNKKFAKELSKIDYILPETDILVDIFKEFYGLNQVYKLNNFRECTLIKEHHSCSSAFRLVFLSRVTPVKGIFDLLDVVKSISKEKNVMLDIYGAKNMTERDSEIFDTYLDGQVITYKGLIDNKLVCDTISKYDLFVFPTRYYGEGTPGVIAESLIAGVPVLTTDFPQSHFLLKDGVDSLFCKMLDKEDMKSKLLYIINNRQVLATLKNGAKESAKNYSYDTERLSFLKYICGIESKKM